jgi:hypothetical protein
VCRGVVLGINIRAREGQAGRMRCRVSLRVVISESCDICAVLQWVFHIMAD